MPLTLTRKPARPGGPSLPPSSGAARPWLTLLTRPGLYLTLLASAVLVMLAYQFERPITLHPGDYSAGLYLENFHGIENSPQIGNFRWSRRQVAIHLPALGSSPQEVIMRLRGGPSPRPRSGSVWVNNQQLATFVAQPDPAITEVKFRLDRKVLWPSGNFDLFFDIERLDYPKDSRSLGAIILDLSVTPLTAERKFVWPALWPFCLLLITAGLLYLAGWFLGLGRSWLAVAPLLVMLLMAVALARYRLEAGAGTGAVCGAVLLGCISLPLLRPLLGWSFGRGGLSVTKAELNPLLGLYLVLFGLVYAGFLDPSFQVIDHMFRVHQVQGFLADPLAFFQHYYNVTTVGPTNQGGTAFIGQWGLTVRFPYPPFFYVLVSPLGLLFRDDKALLGALMALVTFLSVSSVFMVYFLARRFWSNGGTALVAAALAGFMPVGILPLSDGEFLHIAGQWLTLLTLAFVLSVIEKPLGWRGWLGGGVLMTVTFLIFIASFALILSTLLIFSFYLWIAGRLTPASVLSNVPPDTAPVSTPGRMALRVLGLVGLGLVGSSLIYYVYYVVPLIEATLPTIFGKVQRGERIGANPGYLLGFWSQVVANYKILPLGLALVGLGFLVFDRATRLNRLTILLGAAFSTFAVFAVADHFIYFFQKHMIFIAPFVALAIAGGAYELAARLKPLSVGRGRWLLRTGLAATLVLVGVSWLATWWSRAMFYILPPGSG